MGRASKVRRTKGVLGGRSEEVVRRVLDGATAELASSGYVGFRMSEVCSAAGVNKTTIYRRWPNQAALIAAVVDRLREPLRDTPLPNTGALERDLIEAFTRRLEVGRQVEGQAWARLLDERAVQEVDAIIGEHVDTRAGEWRAMITRAIERGELPAATDPSTFLQVVRAIVDAQRLDRGWIVLAVRTVIAGARAGTLGDP